MALAAAQQAGGLALEHFDKNVAVEWKNDRSPVTAADRAAETLLRDQLLGKFPKDGFLGEESGDTPGTSGYRWIVDPIDGTRSFVRGVPIWGTLVGLEYKGETLAGVVSVPAMALTYRALRGEGAFRNDLPIRVSTVDRLSEAHVYYSSVSWFIKGGCERQFMELVKRTERQRGFGDFYGFMLVAQGSGELMVEHGVHAWDLAALKPIVEEAGGKMTDWKGKPDIFQPDVIASNGRLHQAALDILQEKANAPHH
jgi:histidinol-phosphatase